MMKSENGGIGMKNSAPTCQPKVMECDDSFHQLVYSFNSVIPFCNPIKQDIE